MWKTLSRVIFGSVKENMVEDRRGALVYDDQVKRRELKKK